MKFRKLLVARGSSRQWNIKYSLLIIWQIIQLLQFDYLVRYRLNYINHMRV